MDESSRSPKQKNISKDLGDHGSHLAVGMLFNLLASAACLLTGLFTAGFITRQLGPANYGLLTVVAGVVVWLEKCRLFKRRLLFGSCRLILDD